MPQLEGSSLEALPHESKGLSINGAAFSCSGFSTNRNDSCSTLYHMASENNTSSLDVCCLVFKRNYIDRGMCANICLFIGM